EEEEEEEEEEVVQVEVVGQPWLTAVSMLWME
ncbi:uncharacterized, partial [Tachysurus ichikawai]